VISRTWFTILFHAPCQRTLKVVYRCSFKEEWLKIYPWLRKVDKETGLCIHCKASFTVKHNGEKYVKDHTSTSKHQTRVKNVEQNTIMNNFYAAQNSIESDKVCVVEMTMVYHYILHYHSYNSLEFKL
jgi:hypothetical protein